MSMDTKFTKGPWHSSTRQVEDDEGSLICNLSGWKNDGTSKANAHIIAAAPDMYEALAAILPFVPKTSVSEGGASLFSENVRAADKVRAALAKARGKGDVETTSST